MVRFSRRRRFATFGLSTDLTMPGSISAPVCFATSSSRKSTGFWSRGKGGGSPSRSGSPALENAPLARFRRAELALLDHPRPSPAQPKRARSPGATSWLGRPGGSERGPAKRSRGEIHSTVGRVSSPRTERRAQACRVGPPSRNAKKAEIISPRYKTNSMFHVKHYERGLC